MSDTRYTSEGNLISNAYGVPIALEGEQISALVQTFPDGTCTVIYFGKGTPPNSIGRMSDVYINTDPDPDNGKGDVYQFLDGEWTIEMNICGPMGKPGPAPFIGENGNWYVDNKDTGIIARGTNGKDGEQGPMGLSGSPGITPHIGDNGDWFIGDVDTGVYAHGVDGITPQIGDNGNWFIGNYDTNVYAHGKDGCTPTVDPNTGNWVVDGVDTGLYALGKDGVTPHIGGNNNWFIGEKDTGVAAFGIPGKDGKDGEDGITPHIDDATGNWFIGDVDTGIKAKGDTGNTGLQGPKGDAGTTPHIGDNGNWFLGDVDTGINASGIPGVTGPQGPDGIPGENGADGKDGITPHVGENGNWFLGDEDTGTPARGPQGEEGPPGQDGRDGQDGAAGRDGVDGVDGKDGEDGATPYVGSNGNWFVGSTDTGTKAQGPTGDKGEQGPPGQDGAAGISPHVGENGNWYVGDEDTFVHAKGETGDKGMTGAAGLRGSLIYPGTAITGTSTTPTSFSNAPEDCLDGDIYINTSTWNFYQCIEDDSGNYKWKYIGNIKGAKGDKGDTGATGATGPQGATGAKGATGAQGPQGIQGPKGDTGATGPKGDTGAKGATGAQGPKGDKGDTGPQGPKGDTGAKGSDASIPSGLTSGYVRTGQKSGTTIGENATAEGTNTTSSKNSSHAEGWGCTATASAGHAEGYSTTATDGDASHAEGSNTTASGVMSHAGGNSTIASAKAQTAIGQYNVQHGTDKSTIDSLFIVGNGTSSSARSNAFRVHSDGTPYGKKAYSTSGADYAEYFEWEDGNPNEEDRRGYFVTIRRDKIKKATPNDDYILGVISGKPSVIGNSDPDNWHGHFLCDEFGEFIMEKVTVKQPILRTEEIEETFQDENGNEQVRVVSKVIENYEEVEVDSYVVNPDYDPDKPYVRRDERPEWAAVGMLGVLLVRDDNTCQIDGYCRVADGGIATASDIPGWRVIDRINDHLIKIVFK